jgi:hypothetical protein
MPPSKRASLKNNNPLDKLFGPALPTVETNEKIGNNVNDDKNEQAEGASLRQTTILVYDEQLNWLEQKCTEARSKGGKPIRKAVIMRALLDLAIRSEVDLSGLKSELDLAKRLEQAIIAKTIK